MTVCLVDNGMVTVNLKGMAKTPALQIKGFFGDSRGVWSGICVSVKTLDYPGKQRKARFLKQQEANLN